MNRGSLNRREMKLNGTKMRNKPRKKARRKEGCKEDGGVKRELYSSIHKITVV